MAAAAESDFNEAGAKSAGKRDVDYADEDSIGDFNEAGAKSAGKQREIRSGAQEEDALQ